MTPLVDHPTLEIATEVVGAAYAPPEGLVRRHAGLPSGMETDPRWEAMIAEAGRWYRDCGEPWAAMRSIAVERIEGDSILLAGGRRLSSALLARGMLDAGVESVIVAATTAGDQIDRRIAELWQANRPDEALFANAWAIAAVEHMRARLAEHLDEAVQRQGLLLLPQYSPGYEGWSLADQLPLWNALTVDGLSRCPIAVLAGGGLSPAKSTLSLFGIATNRRTDGEIARYWNERLAAISTGKPAEPSYAFSEKTLALWRTKRLRLTHLSDGCISAVFHAEGSTCTSMGLPLAFDYRVELRPEAGGGYRITRVDCQPAADRPGYQSMCAYLDNPARFMAELAEHRPLAGSTLEDALVWSPPVSPAGCLCSRASQDHKWRAAFHAIHYALNRHE